MVQNGENTIHKRFVTVTHVKVRKHSFLFAGGGWESSEDQKIKYTYQALPTFFKKRSLCALYHRNMTLNTVKFEILAWNYYW